MALAYLNEFDCCLHCHFSAMTEVSLLTSESIFSLELLFFHQMIARLSQKLTHTFAGIH
jgi:hypothetical protein